MVSRRGMVRCGTAAGRVHSAIKVCVLEVDICKSLIVTAVAKLHEEAAFFRDKYAMAIRINQMEIPGSLASRILRIFFRKNMLSRLSLDHDLLTVLCE